MSDKPEMKESREEQLERQLCEARLEASERDQTIERLRAEIEELTLRVMRGALNLRIPDQLPAVASTRLFCVLISNHHQP